MFTLIKYIVIVALVVYGLSYFNLINFSFNNDGINNLADKAKNKTTELARQGVKVIEETTREASQ